MICLPKVSGSNGTTADLSIRISGSLWISCGILPEIQRQNLAADTLLCHACFLLPRFSFLLYHASRNMERPVMLLK